MQQQFQVFKIISVWWLKKPGLRLVENSQKTGFQVQRNLGWKHKIIMIY